MYIWLVWSSMSAWWIMKVKDNFGTIHQQQEISYPAGMTLSQRRCLLQGVPKKNFKIEFFEVWQLWALSGHYGHFWMLWTRFDIFGHSGNFWAHLGTFGHSGHFLGTLGTFGHSGHFWALWALLGTLGTWSLFTYPCQLSTSWFWPLYPLFRSISPPPYVWHFYPL